MSYVTQHVTAYDTYVKYDIYGCGRASIQMHHCHRSVLVHASSIQQLYLPVKLVGIILEMLQLRLCLNHRTCIVNLML